MTPLNAPCPQCGYNGKGFYQPATHPCVKGLTPLEIELGEALVRIINGLGITTNNPEHFIDQALAHYREAKEE
jgi:hypothetical protein